MLAGAYALLVAIPTDVLNALGIVAGGIGTGVFYLWGRFRKLPAAATAEPPRAALSETDRELGFTLVRTGTDLTRALHEHGDLLRDALPAQPGRRNRPRT